MPCKTSSGVNMKTKVSILIGKQRCKVENTGKARCPRNYLIGQSEVWNEEGGGNQVGSPRSHHAGSPVREVPYQQKGKMTNTVTNQPQNSPVLVPKDPRGSRSRGPADNTGEVSKASTGHLKSRRTSASANSGNCLIDLCDTNV